MALPRPTVVPGSDVDAWRREIVSRVQRGARFAGAYGTARGEACQLTALVAAGESIDCLSTLLIADGTAGLSYPSLTPQVPAAFWYERALHDLSGVVPVGHPRLDPLLLPLPEGSRSTDARPRPGLPIEPDLLYPSDESGPVDVTGRGMFTTALGPVRSGVFESIEFLVETPGEDIPHLNIRPHFKHRGIAKRFEGLGLDDGALVAERVEGVASVAHALAYAHAIEAIGGLNVPRRARLLRVVYAELERIANHLDVAMRLCDAAGLAVATARFGWHKEAVMRLVSRMCGSRFGRGVVVPGGVQAEPALAGAEIVARVAAIHARVRADAAALMNTASFLDRVRGAGWLDPAVARAYGALGPVGRASGFDDDDRWRRGADAYSELSRPASVAQEGGDAMARLRVRWAEIDAAVALIAEACEQHGQLPAGPVNVRVPAGDGFAAGWAEAPQGEVIYAIELWAGRIRRCLARSASFHNLVLFHDVWHGDITTDFPFIEASFGLSYAAVAM